MTAQCIISLLMGMMFYRVKVCVSFTLTHTHMTAQCIISLLMGMKFFRVKVCVSSTLTHTHT